jgi:hypothetical protein
MAEHEGRNMAAAHTYDKKPSSALVAHRAATLLIFAPYEYCAAHLAGKALVSSVAATLKPRAGASVQPTRDNMERLPPAAAVGQLSDLRGKHWKRRMLLVRHVASGTAYGGMGSACERRARAQVMRESQCGTIGVW